MTPEDRIRSLGIWHGPIDITPITGGITNRNYLVRDRTTRRVVRLGEDIPVHHIIRQNELAASQAAHAAGLSPEVVHHAPGILVLDYIEARALSPDDIRNAETLARVIPLVRACHHDIAREFRGAAAIFWVFHVIRDYIANLDAANSPYRPLFPSLLAQAERLEAAAGPFEIAFGHNDMLAANFLDDGKRLWLIDWDYAGFNTPMFDLGGLASNNELAEDAERSLLEAYYQRALTPDLWQRYRAMKCASLLREMLWSMVSEIHSTIDFDYAGYTAENRARFERAYDAFEQDIA